MYRKYVKSTIDIIIALILILLLWPLILIIAIITYVDLGTPIWNVRRRREGKNKKIYIMYKFRTKKINKEGKEVYTKASRIIDKFRLNELPQLFNVLKGDMALVGPRPFIPDDDLPEGEVSPKRYFVKPGMTGLAQVNGGRCITHKQKLEYDVKYYDNMSFLLDLEIVIKTIGEILFNGLDKEQNTDKM